jgi:quinol monooxygenase YgiN
MTGIEEYIRYRIDADRHEAFTTAYRLAAQALQDSPYCVSYQLAQCEEEPNRFIVHIRWTSTADHLQGFRRSEQFRRFFTHVRPYVGDIEEMNHYHALDAASAETCQR